MRRKLYWLLLFAACLNAQAKQRAAKIDASAVWQMPEQFMTAAHASCDQLPATALEDCMISQMQKAGAPAHAITFTRELFKQNGGELGIMTDFQDEGPLGFAWITYPLRANTNYGFLLVNGQPHIVNVEDLKLLDAKAMKQSFQFRDLKGQFPNVDLWPGDRSGKIWPNSQAGPNGGLQFTVQYPLLNGCHACASAGFAIFNWDFDARGKFLGTTFEGLIDPPLQ